MAALLSLLSPGLGHLYIGKYFDAIVFLVATGFLWYVAFVPSGSQAFNFSSPRAYIFWAGLVFVYVYAIVDAFRKAGKN